MGYFWQRRGVQSPSAASTFKSITVSSGLTVTGTFTAAGGQVFGSSAMTVAKTFTASSQSTLTKLVSFSSGFKVPVQTGTTAANFKPYGLTNFGSTAAKSYTLGTPKAGQPAWLYCTAATTAAVQKVFAHAGTTIQFVSTAGSKNVMQFKHTGQVVAIMGYSTTKWLVPLTGALTFSTV